MHTNTILTNIRFTDTQRNSTNKKLKPGLGAFYAIHPGNGSGLFYSCQALHWARHPPITPA